MILRMDCAVVTMKPADRPYHYWKFRVAVEGLAEGDGSLRQRLLGALLSMPAILENELPEPVRSTFLELQAHVTWKQDGDPDEGVWANTLAAMSDQDAGKVAALIVKLFAQSLDPECDEDDG